MANLLLEGMQGLGDNIYQYPIVKELARENRVFLRTPWPQVYEGLDIKFVKPPDKLRTQSKNANGPGFRFYTDKLPPILNHLSLNYSKFHNSGIPIPHSLLMSIGMDAGYFRYFLQIRKKSAAGGYVVIRPSTVRTEWRSASRCARSEYIQMALDYCKYKGLRTVVIADVNPPHETYYEERPKGATVYYEKGELNVVELMDMVHNARMVIGGVGFIVPMCIALGTPGIIIHGGAGGWNAPELIDCPGHGRLTHVLPKKYCYCRDHNHVCNKEIDPKKLKEAIDSEL
jgi:hypothetical protein